MYCSSIITNDIMLLVFASIEINCSLKFKTGGENCKVGRDKKPKRFEGFFGIFRNALSYFYES